MRSRMLGALVLTALATLVAAALALLAPLESQLRGDSLRIGEATVTVDRGGLSSLPLTPAGEPVRRALDARLEQFFHNNGAVYVIWDERLTRIDDTDRDDRRAIDKIAPSVVRRALYGSAKTPHTLRSDVLVVAIRYRDRGRRFVLEMIKRVDAVTVAGSVVRNALIWAALIGLGVASAFGLALSSRLVRRLRLLRDTSRALLENEPSAGGMPRDDVPDEIGEVASGLRTLHERLQLQEQARRVFIATASHELRTPLASMEGALELLEEDLAEDAIDIPDARQRVAAARRQARRLSALAADLLDLSRLDARLELRSEPVELGETARAVAAEFELRAADREVAIEIDKGDGLSWADADPSSVARVLRILLDNALRFAPAGSSVTIRVGSEPERLVIEVSDGGPGVPDDERELIFERFQRGRDSGAESGFGLGLAIGLELATRMGGLLELTGEPPGATFRLTLPPASAALEALDEPVGAGPSPAP
jgi:signal transduction histidine kinase